MVILDRIRRIISSNINSLIEKAEDPESLLKELIREMDENIINLRNEIVRSVAGEKRLARRIESTKEKIQTWQANSEKAVQDDNDELARKAIARKIQEEQRMSDLVEHHKRAFESSESMKEQLRILEDKVQDARRRKEILVARKRSAQVEKAMLSATHGFAKAAPKPNRRSSAHHLWRMTSSGLRPRQRPCENSQLKSRPSKRCSKSQRLKKKSSVD